MALLFGSPRDLLLGGAASSRRGSERAATKVVGWGKFGIRRHVGFMFHAFIFQIANLFGKKPASIEGAGETASDSGSDRKLQMGCESAVENETGERVCNQSGVACGRDGLENVADRW